MKQYYIYIVTNKGRTTLYIGVTNSLMRRVAQHRQGDIPGFSKRYNTNRLVYHEQYNDVRDAIAREKQLKGWSRKKKEGLINGINSRWTDLAVSVLGLGQAPSKQWQEQRGWCEGDPSTSLVSHKFLCIKACHAERPPVRQPTDGQAVEASRLRQNPLLRKEIPRLRCASLGMTPVVPHAGLFLGQDTSLE